MHIPDGFLSPQTEGGLFALMVPAWYWAGHKVKSAFQSKQAPLVAMGAAFSFVIMMFNIPLPGGTTGHAVGGTIVAIVIGPWAALIAITVALAIQAVFFGDGGILAFGANCFNMALALPFSGYFVYRLFSGKAEPGSRRGWLAAGAGAYFGINLAAFLAALEFGIQGEFFKTSDGSALYSPYGLAASIPAMVGPHLLIGLVEALVTSLVFVFLKKTDPSLLKNYSKATATAGKLRLKPLLVGLLLLLVFAPLGLLATGSAWGEWGPVEVSQKIGYIPQGMQRFAGLWQGVLPGYAFPKDTPSPNEAAGSGNSGSDASAGNDASSGSDSSAPNAAAKGNSQEPGTAPASLDGVRNGAAGYLISGIIGMLAIGGVSLMAIRFISRSHRKEAA